MIGSMHGHIMHVLSPGNNLFFWCLEVWLELVYHFLMLQQLKDSKLKSIESWWFTCLGEIVTKVVSSIHFYHFSMHKLKSMQKLVVYIHVFVGLSK